MPIVHEDDDLDVYSDDSFSDKSEEELRARETPTSSRPRSANRRPGSARRAPPNKPPSPYLNRSASSKSRPRSADPGKKTGRELWLQSLRHGEGVRSSNYVGPVKTNAWGSCSDYLKQTVLGMPPKRHSRGSTMDGPMRATKRAPAYKPQEDMYDDILDLKKSVNTLKAENDRLKARNRRLEDDHARKERQIEQLLDPSQANLRATLSSKQPDTAAKVSNLKQKSLKLEMTLKDKEAELAKLQNDLKTTKVEEMRVAMESFYQEVLRLRHHIKTGTAGRASRGGQEANQPAKMKALNGTILRLTESNQRLQSENKLLKQDLDRALDDGPLDTTTGKKRKGKKKEYEDMNRRELLVSIADLEEKLDKLEGRGHHITNGRHGDVPGKIPLSGSLADRLDQLDKRETELLEEKNGMAKDLKRLKDEKSKLRQKVEDSEFEILSLQKQVDQLKDDLEESNNRKYRSSRETTPRESVRSSSLKRHSSQESINKTLTPRSGSLKRHPSQESIHSQRSSRASHRSKAMSKVSSSSSVRRRQREEEDWIRERDRRLEEFTQNRSAKNIQKNWRAHKQRVKDRDLDSSDMEDAALTIQSAVRGHRARKDALENSSEASAINSDDGSEMSDAAMMIQSAVRGHWSRKDQLQRRDTASERGSVRSRSRSAGSKGSRPESIQEDLNGDINSNDSDSDDIVSGSHSARSIRSNSSQKRPSSAKRSGSGRESYYSNKSTDRYPSARSSRASRTRDGQDDGSSRSSRTRDGQDDVFNKSKEKKLYSNSPPLENGISDRQSITSHRSGASHKSSASRHSKASHKSEASHHSKTSRHTEVSHHSNHRSPSPDSDESHHSTSSRRSKAASHHSKAPSHRSDASHHSKAPSHHSEASHHSKAPSHRSDASHHSKAPSHHSEASHHSKAPSHRSEMSHHSKAPSHHSEASHHSKAPSHHSEASHHSKASQRSKPASHRSPSPRSEASHHSKASRHSSASKKSAAPSHRSSRRDSPAEEIGDDDDIPVAQDSDSGEAF